MLVAHEMVAPARRALCRGALAVDALGVAVRHQQQELAPREAGAEPDQRRVQLFGEEKREREREKKKREREEREE